MWDIFICDPLHRFYVHNAHIIMSYVPHLSLIPTYFSSNRGVASWAEQHPSHGRGKPTWWELGCLRGHRWKALPLQGTFPCQLYACVWLIAWASEIMYVCIYACMRGICFHLDYLLITNGPLQNHFYDVPTGPSLVPVRGKDSMVERNNIFTRVMMWTYIYSLHQVQRIVIAPGRETIFPHLWCIPHAAWTAHSSNRFSSQPGPGNMHQNATSGMKRGSLSLHRKKKGGWLGRKWEYDAK